MTVTVHGGDSRALSREMWSVGAVAIIWDHRNGITSPSASSWNGAAPCLNLPLIMLSIILMFPLLLLFLKQIISTENSNTSQSLSDCPKAAECYRGTWLEQPRSGNDKVSLDIF